MLGACGSDDAPTTTSLADGGTSRSADGGTVTPDDGGSVTPPGHEDAGALRKPGEPCLLDGAGEKVATSCADNPALPTCYQCVDLSANGTTLAPVCAYSCRVGQQDCPQGQTCTKSDNASRTSMQECRNKTGGFEVGYCK